MPVVSRQISPSDMTIRPAFVIEFIERERVTSKHQLDVWIGVSEMTIWEYLLLHIETLAVVTRFAMHSLRQPGVILGGQ